MPKTKRVQVLMEPQEFEVLRGIARSRNASVADLMREAVFVRHLSGVATGGSSAAALRFLSLPDVKLPPWKSLKKEIEARRDASLP